VSGTGEADNRAKKPLWAAPDAATQPKETTMYRMFTTAAVLALTISAAQADDQLDTRIHDAAKAACAKAVAHQTQPSTYYNALLEHCIDSTSKSATAKYQALAATAARAKLAGK